MVKEDKVDRIQEIIARMQTFRPSNNQETSTIQDSYDCAICKDDEWIREYEMIKVGDKEVEREYFTLCKCRDKKTYQRILDSSGISEEYRKFGFKGFETEGLHPIIEKSKAAAISYVKSFESIKKERRNSIAFLASKDDKKKIGIGAGKTHLSIAIANNLMAQNIGVMYMPYIEAITHLKQIIIDDEEYKRQINRYKNAPVLLIDDLFKCKQDAEPTASDLKIMFEIINYRYIGYRPIIISSEWSQADLVNFDEAIGSRIVEMARNYLIQYSLDKNEIDNGISLNYRLR